MRSISFGYFCIKTKVTLKNIEHLLLNLLQLVLHLHHEFLDVDLVGLRAHSVDLATHLLADEP